MSIVDGFLVTRLIQLIKGYPCLYDPRNEQHSNRAMVNSIWKSVAFEMGQPETLCREKWINLRSNFARELRKTRRKMVEDGKASSQWIFYDAMSFLAPFVRTRLATVDNVIEPEEIMRFKTEIEDPLGSSMEPDSVLEEDVSQVSNEYCTRKTYDEMDGDKLFLLSLHSKLKQLPLLDNLSFRIEVQTLLFQKLKAAMDRSIDSKNDSR